MVVRLNGIENINLNMQKNVDRSLRIRSTVQKGYNEQYLEISI